MVMYPRHQQHRTIVATEWVGGVLRVADGASWDASRPTRGREKTQLPVEAADANATSDRLGGRCNHQVRLRHAL